MTIFLVGDELERERNLFAAHEVAYYQLDGIRFDISTFVEVSEDDNMPQIPSSC